MELVELREEAHLVNVCPSRTRNAPYTQTLSGPRAYSSGALMRCPFADQPGAGANVRAVTGPNSSVQTVVEPRGGSV